MKLRLSTVAILLSLGLGAQISFEDATNLLETSDQQSTHCLGISDMNNDNKDDIIRFMNGYQTIIDLQEEPNMPFTENALGDINGGGPGYGSSPWGIAIGDYNNDGLNDIVSGGAYDEIKISTNVDGMVFNTENAPGENIFVQGINFFDINNDGLADIFACHDDGLSKVLINNGDGTFTQSFDLLQAVTDLVSDNSGNYGSCFTDVDNNGHCDLFLAKCRQGVQDVTDPRRINLLYINDGDSGFESNGANAGLDTGLQTWSADFGDYDNDGDLDCVMVHHDGLCEFYENQGDGTFTDISVATNMSDAYDYTPIQCSFQDFDNDGWIDVIITGTGNNTFCMNNGDGTFTLLHDLIDFSTNSYAIGDLNEDGFLDLIMTSGGFGGSGYQSDRLYLNNTDNDNSYLRVKVNGVASNSNGIGARIEVTSDNGTQIRDIKSGEAYGICNSLFQHFGLATGLEAQVVVYWPNGTIEDFGLFNANQTISLEQGTGSSVGLAEFYLNEIDVNFFPNPSFGNVNFNIIGYNFTDGGLQFELIDLNGRVVYSDNILFDTFEISNQNLSSGIYTYKISHGISVVSSDKLVIR